MTITTTATRGDAEWVSRRLEPMWSDPNWAGSADCGQLIRWLYSAAARRAKLVGVAAAEREEIVQDAMPKIVAALQSSNGLKCAENPAAVLERVVARAVLEGAHRMRMEGLGGVSPNGRNWRTSTPRLISGEAAWHVIEAIPDEVENPEDEIGRAVATVASWVIGHLGVVLTQDGMHAAVYVLDRLIAGASRAALVRGHAGLGADPAMSHLGFDPAAARAFGRWLLGRADQGHAMPSVLDAALLGEPVSSRHLIDWRRTALERSFAAPAADSDLLDLPARAVVPDRRIA